MKDKSCHCRNVTRYGDVWQCLLCRRPFLPANQKVSNLERDLQDDYKPIDDLPSRVNGSGTG